MRARKRIRVVAIAAGLLGMLVFIGACDDVYTTDMMVNDFLDSQSSSQQTADSTANTGDDDVDGILGASAAMVAMQEADELLAQGWNLHTSGEYDTAATYIDRAIEKRPQDARYRRARAMTALGQNDAGGAKYQWSEQDRIAEQMGWTSSVSYWEGAYADTLTMTRELERLGIDPLEYDAALDQRAAAIYNRQADTILEIAAFEAAEGDEDAVEMLEYLADDLRKKAQRHGG